MNTYAETMAGHARNVDGIRMELVSYRLYGQPKLKKPAILKGLKPVDKIRIIGKHCAVYELENRDVVLHMGELFCKETTFPDKEDMALPASALAAKYNLNRKFRGFIYPDAWCRWLNLNEGYILVKGLRDCFRDLFGLKIGPIEDKLFDEMRRLSMTDDGFSPLGIDDDDGAAYRRVIQDLIYRYRLIG